MKRNTDATGTSKSAPHMKGLRKPDMDAETNNIMTYFGEFYFENTVGLELKVNVCKCNGKHLTQYAVHSAFIIFSQFH